MSAIALWSHELPGGFLRRAIRLSLHHGGDGRLRFERRRCCAGQARQARTLAPSAVVSALADPTVRQRLAALGQEIRPRDHQTSDVLAALQKAEIEKWWPIVKAAKIKAE